MTQPRVGYTGESSTVAPVRYANCPASGATGRELPSTVPPRARTILTGYAGFAAAIFHSTGFLAGIS
jgi:hypothetical protein